MRKLKLTLETLHVESFETRASRVEGEGTVHGHDTNMPSCWPECSFDTLCVAGPCDTQRVRTCGTCHEPHYVSQCGGWSCFDVC